MTAKHTPGPWEWSGDNHNLFLSTTHSGRLYVMGFERMGMRSAQPTFQIKQKGMIPASEIVQFAVGDASVRSFKAAKENRTVYRYDVIGIDHPDARLIAAAPELLEALREFASWRPRDEAEEAAILAARAVIAKAEGSE